MSTLTTDRSVYHMGEPIQFAFTETNTSSQPVNIAVAPSQDGFDVSKAGVPVWQSNAGINPSFVELLTLQPGQSHTFSSTWDGVASAGDSQARVPGTFTVTNQLSPDGPSATFQILFSGGVVVSPIKSVPPLIDATVATDRSSYKPGQRVSISLTLTNTTNQAVPLRTKLSMAAIRIYRGSDIVGQGSGASISVSARPKTRPQKFLAAGQSETITSTWVAGRHVRGAKTLQTGVYTIIARDGGYSALATIQVGE